MDYVGVYALHAAVFPTPAEANLVERLRREGDAVISLVAVADRHVIGHVAHPPTFPALG